jgi:hypothetical protein
MAKQLIEKIFVSGGYLDSNASVNSLGELKDKLAFLGQSVHMPMAFENTSGVPYPIDFWSVPTIDEDVKWVIKSLPSINTYEDFALFKKFISDFKTVLGYFPISEGFKIIVDGEEYSFELNENGGPIWNSTQVIFDNTISDAITIAVEDAVNAVTSGASETFDTLKEIEDWINNKSASDEEQINALKSELKDYTDDAISVIVGSDVNKTIRTIASEEIAAQLIGEDANESLDTLEEIAAWIQSHPEDAASMNADIIELSAVSHTHLNKDVIDNITSDKVASWDNAESNAKSYTDEVASNIMLEFNWVPVEGDTETHKVRNWRGPREKYEKLLKNNALDSWTRYVVIDTINNSEVYTEYFGANQVADLTGQLLPVNDILGNITEAEAAPYKRYLVGRNGVGYNTYECVLDSDNVLRWIIKPFDYKYGVRVISKGLKNYVYVNGQLVTYDDIDCGTF